MYVSCTSKCLLVTLVVRLNLADCQFKLERLYIHISPSKLSVCLYACVFVLSFLKSHELRYKANLKCGLRIAILQNLYCDCVPYFIIGNKKLPHVYIYMYVCIYMYTCMYMYICLNVVGEV